MILEESHTTGARKWILTHGATTPSRLKTFVTPFGWGKDRMRKIATLEQDKFSTHGLRLHFWFHVRLQQICQVHGEELANILQLDSFSELLGLTRSLGEFPGVDDFLVIFLLVSGAAMFIPRSVQLHQAHPISRSQASVLVTIQQASQSANGLVEVEWTWGKIHENPLVAAHEMSIGLLLVKRMYRYAFYVHNAYDDILYIIFMHILHVTPHIGVLPSRYRQ